MKYTDAQWKKACKEAGIKQKPESIVKVMAWYNNFADHIQHMPKIYDSACEYADSCEGGE